MPKKPKGTGYRPGRTDYGTPMAKPTKADMDMERKYKAEDALRTLTRAEEIRKDKTLMADVRKCATEQKKAIEKALK